MVKTLVIDACCMLNLLATRRELEIVTALGLRLLDTPQTCSEPLTLWSLPDDDGQRLRQAASSSRLRNAGFLQTQPLDSEPLMDAFVAAATQIKDTDASCIALA